MSDYHINIFFSEEDGGYIADIPDLAHCAAFGETPEQALDEVLKAKAAWIEAARLGRSIKRIANQHVRSTKKVRGTSTSTTCDLVM